MKQFLLVLVGFAPLALFAQWSGDPSQNLTIFPGAANSTRYNGITTINGCKDGSSFITWFDLDTVLHVQLYDKDGFALWDPDLVTFRNLGFKAISSFLDIHENLYLHLDRYQESISGYQYILLKVDKSGHKVFGENGFVFQDPNRIDNTYNIHYSVNNQEDVFFSINRAADSLRARTIHRITRDGSLPWGEHGITIPISQESNFIFRETITTQTDGFYVLYGKYIGIHHDDSSYDVYIRKYDLNGQLAWDRDVMVYKGYLQTWSIRFLKGSSDDFYMCWSPSFIQHIYPDGSTEWEGGGLEVISDSTAWCEGYDIVGLNRNGELMVSFCRRDIHYKNPHLYGQLIGKNEQRLWGDAGRPIEISDFSENYAGTNNQFRMMMNNDSVFIFFPYPLPAFNVKSTSIRVMAIDMAGSPVWNKSIELSSNRSFVSLPQVTPFVNNQAILLWSESNDTKKGILKAQNMHSDGTIGLKTSSSEMEISSDKSFFLDQNYPNPFSDRTGITYSIESESRVKIEVADFTS